MPPVWLRLSIGWAVGGVLSGLFALYRGIFRWRVVAGIDGGILCGHFHRLLFQLSFQFGGGVLRDCPPYCKQLYP